MKQHIIAAVVVSAFVAHGAAVVAQDSGYGRVVLLAKDANVESDGRMTVTLPSGTRLTFPPTDLDRKMMLALGEPADAAPAQAPGATPTTNRSIPTLDAAMSGIRTKCALEWPTDFRMQNHCQIQQRESLSTMWLRINYAPEYRTIRNQCYAEWPDDFRMQNHCEEQQLKALAAIRRP